MLFIVVVKARSNEINDRRRLKRSALNQSDDRIRNSSNRLESASYTRRRFFGSLEEQDSKLKTLESLDSDRQYQNERALYVSYSSSAERRHCSLDRKDL